MNIGGRYVSKASLACWQRNVDSGDVPALWAEFEFLTLKGPPERLAMWCMMDTGADLSVVPPYAIGLLLPGGGSPPRFAQGSIGSRLFFRPSSIRGVNGVGDALLTSARIKLSGTKLPSSYMVMIGGNMDFPIIGRDVLNRFVGLLNPRRQQLSLSDGMCMQALASCATRSSNSARR